VRLDHPEAQRLENLPRQDPAMHPPANADGLGRKKHVLANRGGLTEYEVASLALQVGQRQDVVPIEKATLDPFVGSGWPKIKAVVDNVHPTSSRCGEAFEPRVDELGNERNQRKAHIADRYEQCRAGHIRIP